MREVGVIHRGGNTISIRQDPQVSRAGESVLWQFYSTDRRVKWAKIEFENDKSKFFDSREGATHKKVFRLKKGHGHTVGTAPLLGAPAADPRKYTVYFYRNEPKTGEKGENVEKEVAKLDPEIIICNP